MPKGYPYPQPKLNLVMREPAGTPRKTIAKGEEICPSSITVLTESYIHPTTIGKIALPTRGGAPRLVGGEVIACQHAKGRDHRVIFKFDESIALDEILGPDEAAEYLEAVRTGKSRKDEAPVVSVLYLDDHEADLRLFTTRLAATNIDVRPVAHLGAAMDAVETTNYDLVICDYYLEPPHTAHDLLTQFKERQVKTPVVVLTSDIDPDRAIQLATDGVVAVLNKPVDYATIAETLTAIAAGSESKPKPVTTDDATSAFLGSLGKRRSQLKRAIVQRNPDPVLRLCRDLAGASAGYGYVALGRAADRAIGAIEGAGSVDLAGKPLDDLLSQLDRLAPAA